MLFGKHVNGFYIKYGLHILIGLIALVIVDYVQLIVPEYLGDALDNLTNNVPASTYLKSCSFWYGNKNSS